MSVPEELDCDCVPVCGEEVSIYVVSVVGVVEEARVAAIGVLRVVVENGLVVGGIRLRVLIWVELDVASIVVLMLIQSGCSLHSDQPPSCNIE